MLEWLFKRNINLEKFSGLFIGEEFYREYDDKIYVKTSEDTYETRDANKSCIKWFIVNKDFAINEKSPCKT